MTHLERAITDAIEKGGKRDYIKEFRKKYTHFSNPNGTHGMTMWRSGQDPEDALRDILELVKEAEVRGRNQAVDFILKELGPIVDGSRLSTILQTARNLKP